MKEEDLSAVGSDVEPGVITDLAKKEERAFGLETLKETHLHHLKSKEQDLGRIGRFFGSRDNAIVYSVILIVFISLILLAILSLSDQTVRPVAVEIIKVIIYAGVGFLTGKSLDARSGAR